MRSTCSVHVDVGYLVAACATYVTGSSLRRGVVIDYPTLVRRVVEQAEADSGLPLLRVNWYDSGARPGGMPDFQQDEIGQLPGVKLRLGRLSHFGEQKGVDIRIGLDLAIQAERRVSDVVYLVSGDDDLTEAVEVAQSYGVEVVLLAVPDRAGRPHGVSRRLRREVDSLLVIAEETVAATVRSVSIPTELLPAGAKGDPPVAEGPAPCVGSGSAQDGGARSTRAVELDEATPPGEATAEPGPAPAEPALRDGASAPPAPAPPAPATVPARSAEPGPPSHRVAGEAEDHPAEACATPPGPSPAVFARRRATALVLPGPGTSHVAYDPEVGVTLELVDAVANQLVASWVASATPESLVALRAARPAVPGELDRALLVDLSNLTQGAVVDDETRALVRERFWLHVERVRMS